jgi:zinc/manganese transport system ATP-binding protein
MICLDDIYFRYRDSLALEGISMNITPGTLMAIVGGNGAGKTTLLNIISGLEKPSQGSVTFSNEPVIAYLPQTSRLDRDFPFRVMDVVAMGFWRQRGLLQNLTQTQHDEIHQALKTVGLDGYAKRSLNTLSGGQFQRVLFARMMLQHGDILLLDEPFSGVDEPTVEDLMKLLQNWHALGKTIIVVLHDIDLVRRYFNECALVARRLVAFGKTEDVLTTANLAQASFMRV